MKISGRILIVLWYDLTIQDRSIKTLFPCLYRSLSFAEYPQAKGPFWQHYPRLHSRTAKALVRRRSRASGLSSHPASLGLSMSRDHSVSLVIKWKDWAMPHMASHSTIILGFSDLKFSLETALIQYYTLPRMLTSNLHLDREKLSVARLPVGIY